LARGTSSSSSGRRSGRSEDEALALAVQLILEGDPEGALQLLSQHYGVPEPRLRVGLPSRCRRALGCYVARERTIYVRSRSEYRDPFVILHEYYHHLRWRMGRHRGTEKHADRYALRALEAWRRLFGGEA